MGVMRTPGHWPSASFSRWARPVPPWASTRRVFRPRPIPRNLLDIFRWGPRNGPQAPNPRRAPAEPWRASTLHRRLLLGRGVHGSRENLLVGEAGALAHGAEVLVVLRAQRLHVLGVHERAEVR